MHPALLADLRPSLRSPISPQRWRAWKDEIIAELHGRADRLGTTPEEELLLAASAAAQIAQCEGRDEEPRHHAEWVLWYRCRIPNHVTAAETSHQTGDISHAGKAMSDAELFERASELVSRVATYVDNSRKRPPPNHAKDERR
jgi:hypothetical protein